MPDDPAEMIIHALGQADWPRSVSTLAAMTKLRQPVITKVLEKLCAAGVVQRTRRGEYQLPPDAAGRG